MNDETKGLALLPSGFADVLPPRAEGEARSVVALMDVFGKFGYQRVKPPLLEFEDGLLASGAESGGASDMFRVMDPLSHRMLGVRSDVTPQIARIAVSRLKDAPRPLRLAYANDVLRTRGSQQRTERQFTQAGCEMIGGAQGIYGDIEICVLAVLGLKSLGIEQVTIDLTVPNFATILMDGLAAAQRIEIEKAVERRDYDAVRVMDGAGVQAIAAAMSAAGGHEKALAALAQITLPEVLKGYIARLGDVAHGLGQALSALEVAGVTITVDVLEQAGFQYHKGFGFTVFSPQAHGELGRGGSYDVRFGGNAGEAACGFTLYMDTVGKVCAMPDAPRRIMVSVDENWKNIVKLQGDGWVTVRCVSENEARILGCSYLYKGQKIVEIVG